MENYSKRQARFWARLPGSTTTIGTRLSRQRRRSAVAWTDPVIMEPTTRDTRADPQNWWSSKQAWWTAKQRTNAACSWRHSSRVHQQQTCAYAVKQYDSVATPDTHVCPESLTPDRRMPRHNSPLLFGAVEPQSLRWWPVGSRYLNNIWVSPKSCLMDTPCRTKRLDLMSWLLAKQEICNTRIGRKRSSLRSGVGGRAEDIGQNREQRVTRETKSCTLWGLERHVPKRQVEAECLSLQHAQPRSCSGSRRPVLKMGRWTPQNLCESVRSVLAHMLVVRGVASRLGPQQACLEKHVDPRTLSRICAQLGTYASKVSHRRL